MKTWQVESSTLTRLILFMTANALEEIHKLVFVFNVELCLLKLECNFTYNLSDSLNYQIMVILDYHHL